MKTKQIVYVTTVDVAFSKEEVQILLQLARNHYDGACRHLAAQGGLLYALQNCFEVGKKQADWNMKFRDLDLLAKVCEQRIGMPDNKQFQIADELSRDLLKLMIQVNRLQIEINQVKLFPKVAS